MQGDRRVYIWAGDEALTPRTVAIRLQKEAQVRRDDDLVRLTPGEAHSLFLTLKRWGFDQDPLGQGNHRGRNYRLCTAIDLTKLGMVEEEMVKAGADKVDVGLLTGIARSALDALRRLNPKD